MGTGSDAHETSVWSWLPPRDARITMLSGGLAGMAATVAKQPVQRIKWLRQVNEANVNVPYRTLVRDTMRVHGPLGFFSGSMAAMYRNVPHSLLVYTAYPYCERAASRGLASAGIEDQGGGGVKFLTRFVAGYMALSVTTAITHPLDTMRVRLAVRPEIGAGGYVANAAARSPALAARSPAPPTPTGTARPSARSSTRRACRPCTAASRRRSWAPGRAARWGLAFTRP